MRDDEELLVWEMLDGELDAAQQRELERRSEGDPEVRALFRDAEELNRLLATVEEVEVPPALRRQVERRIAAKQAGEPGIWPSLGDRPRALWVPRLAFLAAGILVGALAVQLLGGRVPEGAEELSRFYGAVVPRRATSAVVVPDPQLPGWLELFARDHRLVASIELDGAEPVEMTLRSAAGIEVSAVESGAAHVDLALEPGGLVLRAVGPGACVLSLELEDPAVPVVVSLELAGDLVAETTVLASELERRGEEAER